MPRRAFLAACLCAATACGSPGARDPRASGAPPRPAAIRAPAARFIQSTPDEAYWVEHSAELDRVILGGARLEVSPSGELRAAAWDLPEGRGELLIGSLAVAAHLGGGYLHFTSTRVFRSKEFVGRLSPVGLHGASRGGLQVRGARNAPRAVLVITDSGPLELAPGSDRAVPAKEAGLFDVASLGADRAIRLDVFGRAATTSDGGAHWESATPLAGIAVRSLYSTEEELALDTYHARYVLGPDGKLREPDSVYRSSNEYGRYFQTFFRNTRSAEREGWPWAIREGSPLREAVLAGAPLDDGTALGILQGAVVRVELATGKVTSFATDWLPPQLQCQPLRADDGTLFACSWDSYEAYGAYVLRSVGGEPPTLEHAFTDDGSFVADGVGALGFTGSCKPSARFIDVNDPSRFDPSSADARPQRRFCVRRGPGDWVERDIDAEDASSLFGWVPQKDGGAVALLLANEGDAGDLPEPTRGVGRVAERGGVRVVRLYREIDGWFWARGQQRGYLGRGGSAPIARAFRAHADGTIDGWLSPAAEVEEGRVNAGVTLGRDGRPTVHELPPDLTGMAVGGDFGLAVARDGALHETVDHGKTWRRAGDSPLPGPSFAGGCSALGCALSGLVRVGWGDHRAEVRANVGPAPDPPVVDAALPRLRCTASGAPALPAPPPPVGQGAARLSLATNYGDSIEIVRDAAATDPSAGPVPPASTAAPIATASPSAPPAPGGKGKPTRTVPTTKTHTLFWRPPFEPDAPVRRLNATDAGGGNQRRASVTPLLGPGGEVSLLVIGDGHELLVGASQVELLPAFEARRYMVGELAGGAGLVTGDKRALVLGDTRRRLSLEEHGEPPLPPPMFVGLERDLLRRRQLTLARRDDGDAGILVLDGAAPETVGVAAIERLGGTLSPVTRLAPWSTLSSSDDPRCKGMRGAWRALVLVDPSTWLSLDPAATPGVTLGKQGLVRVLWGTERVCLEAVDLAATDGRRRADAAQVGALVSRWDTSRRGDNAALRWPDLRQGLTCRLEPRP